MGGAPYTCWRQARYQNHRQVMNSAVLPRLTCATHAKRTPQARFRLHLAQGNPQGKKLLPKKCPPSHHPGITMQHCPASRCFQILTRIQMFPDPHPPAMVPNTPTREQGKAGRQLTWTNWVAPGSSCQPRLSSQPCWVSLCWRDRGAAG